LPTELTYLRGMMSRALAATAALWPPVRVAFGWVHRAAHILGQEKTPGESIRRQLGGLYRIALNGYHSRSAAQRNPTAP